MYLVIYLKVLQPSFNIFPLQCYDNKNDLLFDYKRSQTSTISSFNTKKIHPLNKLHTRKHMEETDADI